MAVAQAVRDELEEEIWTDCKQRWLMVHAPSSRSAAATATDQYSNGVDRYSKRGDRDGDSDGGSDNIHSDEDYDTFPGHHDESNGLQMGPCGLPEGKIRRLMREWSGSWEDVCVMAELLAPGDCVTG